MQIDTSEAINAAFGEVIAEASAGSRAGRGPEVAVDPTLTALGTAATEHEAARPGAGGD